MVASLGFEVVSAADGDEAVRVLSERPGAFAFVLLDLMMPGMGGDEVMLEMQRIGATTPVVLSSGYDAEQISRRFVGGMRRRRPAEALRDGPAARRGVRRRRSTRRLASLRRRRSRRRGARSRRPARACSPRACASCCGDGCGSSLVRGTSPLRSARRSRRPRVAGGSPALVRSSAGCRARCTPRRRWTVGSTNTSPRATAWIARTRISASLSS